MTLKDLGTHIRLVSGEYIDLADPKPSDISIYDIAIGLGNTCRFGGQIPKFYSVAEHSILAAYLATKDQCEPKEVFAVLMHDSAEAYVGDLVKPLKILVGDSFVKIEKKIEEAIDQRFDIHFDKFRDVIKHYDTVMLSLEKEQFVGNDGVKWYRETDVSSIDLQIQLLPPLLSANEFVRQFHIILGYGE